MCLTPPPCSASRVLLLGERTLVRALVSYLRSGLPPTLIPVCFAVHRLCPGCCPSRSRSVRMSLSRPGLEVLTVAPLVLPPACVPNDSACRSSIQSRVVVTVYCVLVVAVAPTGVFHSRWRSRIVEAPQCVTVRVCICAVRVACRIYDANPCSAVLEPAVRPCRRRQLRGCSYKYVEDDHFW